MSVASSIPCLKIPTSSPSLSSCSSTQSNSSSSFRFSSAKPYYVTIRNSQTEGPLRRPVAPPLREPSTAPQPLKPTPPSQSPSPPPPSSTVAPSQKEDTIVGVDKGVITLEFQRQKAKELQEYFKQKKLEKADQGPAFGFVGKNEISNGRWAMFGFAVGMLTEYATGSDFVDQVKILLSNFGIVDLE
ncbi:One helix protein 2 [Quillaja saponaria]|uniref:One helix protein 2 n=1 Tax=Quillaja saponaria TaxID=32244 RepID=A0AAD7VFK1_QUISA|nr:One helix protein 2 [Quillaja saponaria]